MCGRWIDVWHCYNTGMPNVLLVKTSSMGDVIHCLPAVSDLQRSLPSLRLDWVVEGSFAEIPALHPAVDRVLPVAIRRWRKAPFSREVREQLAAFRGVVQQRQYDLVIDAQGLLKSAWIGCLSSGVRCGYDWHSAREPLASCFYQRRFPVDRALPAVERNRLLLAAAFGYSLPGQLDYGVRVAPDRPDWLKEGAYLPALHATSRSDKEWSEAEWVRLGRWLNDYGVRLVFPWGSDAEQQRAQRLAASIPGAQVAPRLNLTEAASLLAGAVAVVGVDTGLTHLAAAVGVPVIALYCASEPGLTGVLGSAFHVNLGRIGASPSADEVMQVLQQVLV